jgi:tRNA modification GTPase
VSPIAGTTRDVLEESLDLSRDARGAGTVQLVDLAGLDETPGNTIHTQMQAAASEAIRAADAVLHCDPSGRFPPLATQAPIIRVRTKADLPGNTGPDSISVCALDGWNLPTLRRTIADAACSKDLGALAAVLPRHRRALRQTQSHLRDAQSHTKAAAGAEMIAGSLRLALDSLGELTGHISPDEVIGRIFSTFCIGK